jgi:Ubiquitin family
MPLQRSLGQRNRSRRAPRYNTLAVTDTTHDDPNEQHNNHDDDNDDGDVEEMTSPYRQRANGTNSTGSNNNNNNNSSMGTQRRQQQPYHVVPNSAAGVATTPPPPPPPISTTSNTVMEVTILDFTHKRWPVRITSDHISSSSSRQPTVYDLKRIGSLVHNIPIPQQRLIYQGKLLSEDAVTLSSLGIQTTGSIVHLFPKPRVVVVENNNNNNNNTSTSHQNNNHSNNSSDTTQDDTTTTTPTDTMTTDGARIPTIVMDQSEMDRRSEILVLGHADYVEAVSNVKLFSLMLLIISTIELLNLFSIYIGANTAGDNGTSSSSSGGSNYHYNSTMNQHTNPYYNPGDTSSIPYMQHDDFFHDDDLTANNSSSSSSSSSNNNPGEPSSTSTMYNSTNLIDNDTMDPVAVILQTWTPIKYVDVLVSLVGVYVSILGIRASNENCVRTARAYLFGTTITAIGWLLYNYIVTFEIDVAVASEPDRYDTTGYPYDNNDDYDSDSTTTWNTPTNDDSAYQEALTALVLPAMVWCLCIFRAWQFQHLLHDAELEAAQRIHDHHHPFNEDFSNTDVRVDDDSTYNTTSSGDVELATLPSTARRDHNNNNNNTSSSSNNNHHHVVSTHAATATMT